MTQERYFVVSEAEFEAALSAIAECVSAKFNGGFVDVVKAEKAEAACRARPVPNEATHFALFDEDRPYYTPDDHEAWVTKSWRIEK